MPRTAAGVQSLSLCVGSVVFILVKPQIQWRLHYANELNLAADSKTQIKTLFADVEEIPCQRMVFHYLMEIDGGWDATR